MKQPPFWHGDCSDRGYVTMRILKYSLFLLILLAVISCSGSQQGGNLGEEEDGQIEAPSLGIGSPVDIPVPIAKGMLPVKATSLTIERVVGEEGIVAILRGETQEDNVSVAFFIAAEEESGTPAVRSATSRTDGLVTTLKMEFIDCVAAPGKRFERKIPLDEIGIDVAIAATNDACDSGIPPSARSPEVITKTVDRCLDPVFDQRDQCPDYSLLVETTNTGGEIAKHPIAVSGSLSRVALHEGESSGKFGLSALPLDGGELKKIFQNLPGPMDQLQYCKTGDLFGIDPATKLIRRIKPDGASFLEASGSMKFPADRSLSTGPNCELASTFSTTHAGEETIAIIVQDGSGRRFSIHPREVIHSQEIDWLDANTLAAIQLLKNGVYRVVLFDLTFGTSPAADQTILDEEDSPLSNLRGTGGVLIYLRDVDGRNDLIRFNPSDGKKVILNGGDIGGTPLYIDSFESSSDGAGVFATAIYKGRDVVTMTYNGYTVVIDHGTEAAPAPGFVAYLGESVGEKLQVRIKNLTPDTAAIELRPPLPEKVEETKETPVEEEDVPAPEEAPEPEVTPESPDNPVAEPVAEGETPSESVKPESQPAPKTEPVVTPAPKPAPKTQPKPELKPETKPVTKPEPKKTPAPKADSLSLTGPNNLDAGKCSSAYTVALKDQAGKTIAASADLTVSLSGAVSGKFYNGTSCQTEITQTKISAGKSSTRFYYKNPKGEEVTLQATAPLIKGATIKVIVKATAPPPPPPLPPPPPPPAEPSQFQLNGNATVGAGECTGYTILLQDASGDPASFDHAVSFGLDDGGEGIFYSNVACSDQINSLNLAAGVDSKVFYYKNNKAESVVLKVSKDAVFVTQLDVTVGFGAATKLDLSGPTSITAGHCAGPYVAAVVDEFNNPVPSPATIGLKLYDGNNGGKFFSAHNCGNEITALLIPTGQAAIDFYYQNSVGSSALLRIEGGTVWGDDLLNVFITPAPAPE